MDKVVLGSENIKNSLISAVRKGNLNEVRNLVKSYGLSYSEAWSEGYVLLVEAIKHRHVKVAELLIRKGAKLNSHHKEDPNTPLHLAVKNCNKKIVKMLLKKGADIHVTHTSNNPLLVLAAMNRHIEIVKMLLDRGVDVNVKNTCGYTPLHCAVEKFSEKIVTLLLKSNVNVDIKGKDGRTPLHIAAEKGYVQIAEVLLNHGADIHSACTSTWKEGYMPIHLCSQRGSKEAVELFLRKGADANANTKDNLTPLHFAVKGDHETVVKLLLKHGANVDAQDKSGKTILHLAVEKGNSTIVEDVLKYCPDINNQSNRSSLKTAICGSGETYKKIIEDLLQYGFIVNAEDVDSPELLHNAVAKGSLKIVTDLLNYGADVNVKDMRGLTPLYYITENFDAEITKLLLTNGANVKDSPELLHTAAAKGRLEVIKNLLKYSAEFDFRDRFGRTALYVAIRDGHIEIVDILLEYGSDINITSKKNHTPLEYATLCASIMYNTTYCTDEYDYDFYHSDDSDGSIYLYFLILELLKKHIVRLDVVGLYVSEKNLQSVTNDYSIMFCFREECENEIEIMKSKKIGNSYASFYDILTKNSHQLAIYAKNENIVQAFKSLAYETEFPIYSGMLEAKFRRVVERKELMELGYQFFYSLLENLPQLPLLCIENIFNYLSNNDIKVLHTCM